jgi:hypothetical protein
LRLHAGLATVTAGNELTDMKDEEWKGWAVSLRL